MRIQFILQPEQKKSILPVNYSYFLTGLVYKFIKNSSEDYSRFLHDEGYRLENSAMGFKLFTFSQLLNKGAKVFRDTIVFDSGPIQWFLSSPLDIFLQHLVSGVFGEGQEIGIGPEGGESRFLIERVETLPKPELKETMRFTCLSPITVSRSKDCSNRLNRSNSSNGLSGLSSLSGLNGCHYVRPWEEGFAEAIKNNLMKKYKLVYGKEAEASDLSIRIDPGYMNKRGGRITKNINFKGTNIIGLMAPFEVTGDPGLIEVGYEAGFGEKGSMGFGMVKETVQTDQPD